MSKSKFKVGDKVRLKFPLEPRSWPNIAPGMDEIAKTQRKVTIKEVYINLSGEVGYRLKEISYIWNEDWFTLIEKKGREEELLDKIAYLWNKQEYVKCLNSR